ncbi:MAG: FAD-dependent oxidoreductase, partial [Bacteroidales bacterium]|nr:FAD-dependent oxidoreductase [Bacteroidales bacterium]
MNHYDAAIIGAGLGGLQCAYILAKRGMKVVVVEKGQLLG